MFKTLNFIAENDVYSVRHLVEPSIINPAAGVYMFGIIFVILLIIGSGRD